ncbi:metal-dependent hydrolase, partial [bacterium]|nr:metal-dependent hydrolase [bacterium]
MPSPIAHSIVGFSFASVSKCGVARVFKNNTLNFLLICFVCAAPDLDIIPGIVVGLPALYHHGISHSFGFALLSGFCLSSVIYIFKKKYYFSRALFFTALYSSHIILDLF